MLNYLRVPALIATCLLIAACSLAPYRYQSLDDSDFRERAVTEQQNQITVTTAVPGSDEAQSIFGIPLHEHGIQPVWLEITNHSGHRVRFAPYSLDPNYFTPNEIAYMFRKSVASQYRQDMARRFERLTMQRQIEPGATAAGFVFTHSAPGTKAFNVDVFQTHDRTRNVHLTFFISVPGFTPDHAEINFSDLYAASERRNLANEDQLRAWADELPCCTTNRAGNVTGRPVSVLLLGSGHDLLQALLRGQWRETSYVKDEAYLEATDYLFGRPADAVFRMRRGKGTERSEILLWLTPVQLNGTPVWAVLGRHAIGRLFEIGERFLGVQLDPDVDDERNYLLQNFLYSQSLLAWAAVASGPAVEPDDPKLDFTGKPWYTDGKRFVLWVSGDTVALGDVVARNWDRLQETAQ